MQSNSIFNIIKQSYEFINDYNQSINNQSDASKMIYRKNNGNQGNGNQGNGNQGNGNQGNGNQGNVYRGNGNQNNGNQRNVYQGNNNQSDFIQLNVNPMNNNECKGAQDYYNQSKDTISKDTISKDTISKDTMSKDALSTSNDFSYQKMTVKSLQQAVVMSEILSKPVCKTRRNKRSR